MGQSLTILDLDNFLVNDGGAIVRSGLCELRL